MSYRIIILQSILFFFLLLIFNIFFGAYNTLYNYPGTFLDALESCFGLLICSGIFLFGTIIIKHPKKQLLFLPIFRLLFWSLIIVAGFVRNTRLVSEDLLYANNEFFFGWTTLKILCRKYGLNNEFINLIIVDILSIAIGEFILILIAHQLTQLIVHRKFPK